MRKRIAATLRLTFDESSAADTCVLSSSNPIAVTDSQNITGNGPNALQSVSEVSGGHPNGASRRKRPRILLPGLSDLQAANETQKTQNGTEGCLTPTESPQLLAQALSKLANEQNATSGQNFGGFLLLSPLDSAGFCQHAVHTATKQLYTAQLLSGAQKEHLLRVSARLNSARSRDWPLPPELNRLRHALLPSAAQLIRGPAGREFLMRPRHFGSLHGFVQRNRNLDEGACKALYAQIVRMVAFCHALGIVVRDLKLRKFVFVDEQQTTLGLASLNDLVVLDDRTADQLSDRHGCPAYVSPEILDLTRPGYGGRAADVWSLGVLLFVMLIGRYPFYDSTPAGLFAKIRSGQFWLPTDRNLSVEVKWLLKSLLRKEPTERPTAMALLAVPWLQTGAGRKDPAGPTDNPTGRNGPTGMNPRDDGDQIVPSILNAEKISGKGGKTNERSL